MEIKPIIIAASLVPLLVFFKIDFWIILLIVLGAISFLYLTKRADKKEISLIFVSFLIISHAYYFYFDLNQPASALNLPINHGTVLSDNWWNALNWIKNNTAECSVIATYWDPGHFITGIGRRAVVFDGASQNALFVRPGGNNSGLRIDQYDDGINHIVLEKDNEITTARIQDIATTLLTSNETLAIEILKEYKKPNCTEMYYIASADLIAKSQWWTYFSTWNPNTETKGQKYYYVTVPLYEAKLAQDAIIYTYPMAQNQAFIIYSYNNTLKPMLQQDSQFLTVEKIFYFEDNAGQIIVDENADVKGMVWLSSDKNTLVYILPELENSMFTYLYFFNGAGLENFEFVDNWGGEVKLFKVNV